LKGNTALTDIKRQYSTNWHWRQYSTNWHWTAIQH